MQGWFGNAEREPVSGRPIVVVDRTDIVYPAQDLRISEQGGDDSCKELQCDDGMALWLCIRITSSLAPSKPGTIYAAGLAPPF
jgi:hypothetical protein